MRSLRSSLGPAIALLLAVSAGQAMALVTLNTLSRTDDRMFLHVLVQDRLLETPSTTSPSALTQGQRSLLENLLRLPNLTERHRELIQEALRRNQRLRADVERSLKRILDEQIAELERQRERERIEALQRQDQERQAAEAEAERRRQQEARQAAEAEAERKRQEEARLAAEAEAERRRQEEARLAAEAEAERQRQEEARQAAEAEAERQRQEEARQAAEAEAERQRQEARLAAEAEAERQRQEELRRQQQAAAPDLEVLTEQQRILLGNLMGLSFMSSVERGMMQKVLDDNRRLSDAEEARLQQRYAALKEFDEPPAPPAPPVETGPSTPPPTTSADPPIETGKVDVIDLLPRFKVEMPSPI